LKVRLHASISPAIFLLFSALKRRPTSLSSTPSAAVTPAD
jgi:hypothetical protein